MSLIRQINIKLLHYKVAFIVIRAFNTEMKYKGTWWIDRWSDFQRNNIFDRLFFWQRGLANQRIRVRVERKLYALCHKFLLWRNCTRIHVHYEQTRKLQSTRMVELVAYVYLLSIYMNNWVYYSKALIFTCNGTSDIKKHNSR